MSEESHTHGAGAGREQVRPARSVGDLGGQPRGDAREALEQGGSGRGGRGIMLFLSGDHEEEGQWPSGVPSQPASLRLGPVLQPSGDPVSSTTQRLQGLEEWVARETHHFPLPRRLQGLEE